MHDAQEGVVTERHLQGDVRGRVVKTERKETEAQHHEVARRKPTDRNARQGHHDEQRNATAGKRFAGHGRRVAEQFLHELRLQYCRRV